MINRVLYFLLTPTAGRPQHLAMALAFVIGMFLALTVRMIS